MLKYAYQQNLYGYFKFLSITYKNQPRRKLFHFYGYFPIEYFHFLRRYALVQWFSTGVQ